MIAVNDDEEATKEEQRNEIEDITERNRQGSNHPPTMNV